MNNEQTENKKEKKHKKENLQRGFAKTPSEAFKEEIAKIKSFSTFGEKASYVWGYYKIPFFIIVAVVAMVISIVSSIKKNDFETALYIDYINCVSKDLRDYTDILENNCNEWLGIDGKDTRVQINGYYVVNPDDYSTEAYSSMIKLTANISAQEADIFISDELLVELYSSGDTLYDLKEFLPSGLYEELGDRILFYEDSEGVSHPYAIDLSGLPIIDTLVLSIDKPLLSIVGNAPHQENCAEFIKQFIEYKSE